MHVVPKICSERHEVPAREKMQGERMQGKRKADRVSHTDRKQEIVRVTRGMG